MQHLYMLGLDLQLAALAWFAMSMVGSISMEKSGKASITHRVQLQRGFPVSPHNSVPKIHFLMPSAARLELPFSRRSNESSHVANHKGS